MAAQYIVFYEKFFIHHNINLHDKDIDIELRDFLSELKKSISLKA